MLKNVRVRHRGLVLVAGLIHSIVLSIMAPKQALGLPGACLNLVEDSRSLVAPVRRLTLEINSWVREVDSPTNATVDETTQSALRDMNRAVRARRWAGFISRVRDALLLSPRPTSLEHLRQAQTRISALELTDQRFPQAHRFTVWLNQLDALLSRAATKRSALLNESSESAAEELLKLTQTELQLSALAGLLRDRVAIDQAQRDLVDGLNTALRTTAVTSQFNEFCLAQSFCSGDLVYHVSDSGLDGRVELIGHNHKPARLHGVTDLVELEISIPEPDLNASSLLPRRPWRASPSAVARANPGLKQKGLVVGSRLAFSVTAQHPQDRLLAGRVLGFFADGGLLVVSDRGRTYRIDPSRIQRLYSGYQTLLEELKQTGAVIAPPLVPTWVPRDLVEAFRLDSQRIAGVRLKNGRPDAWIYELGENFETIVDWTPPSLVRRKLDPNSGIDSAWRPSTGSYH